MRAAFALLVALPLGACVQASPEFIGGVLSGEQVVIDGQTLIADQQTNWPRMIPQVDAAGTTTLVQSGTADTVVVSGSPDSRDRAIAALAQYCGTPIDPQGFDTQFVYQDPASGDWWFDGFCG